MSDTSPSQPPGQDDTILIWLDLETTGLDPREGEILEIAVFATDLAGNEVQSPLEQVFTHVREDILVQMDDYVLDMHLGSGLLEKVWADTRGPYYDSTRHSPARRQRDAAWRSVEGWFNRLPGRPKNRHLAGNSIHFDRGWLAAKKPDLLRMVSHRMLDVSSFLIVDPQKRPEGAQVEHRALADARQSFKTYREVFLPRIRTDLYSV